MTPHCLPIDGMHRARRATMGNCPDARYVGLRTPGGLPHEPASQDPAGDGEHGARGVHDVLVQRVLFRQVAGWAS